MKTKSKYEYYKYILGKTTIVTSVGATSPYSTIEEGTSNITSSISSEGTSIILASDPTLDVTTLRSSPDSSPVEIKYLPYMSIINKVQSIHSLCLNEEKGGYFLQVNGPLVSS